MAQTWPNVIMSERKKRICLCMTLGTLITVLLTNVEGVGVQQLTRTRHLHKTRSLKRTILDGDIEPYFDSGTSTNVTTTPGKTAYLPCRVRHLGDRTVSWIRRKDLHVLTVGRFIYSSSDKFQVIHRDDRDDWMLQVKYPQRDDAGQYECQVSTVPKKSLFITLNVIVSKAEILGGPTIYINTDSAINLTCIIQESPVPPDYVFWYHNNQVINYEAHKGVEVKTQMNPTATSTLWIEKAQSSNSGNYSCFPSNADPAEIAVHVLNGENPAAMQHGKHTSYAKGLLPTKSLLIGILTALLLTQQR
ncbi:zwei Ig domain protein zig-8-like isoform X1 [Limulus polyphemus]|uniref:Zwei Ig domain protein zig-8-like isoform X1 n=1 Tax=Limulus polyphemus TaxID=6850 RepID=A0ABM1S4M4_LIMPO|nr:zwei Ig domain protein zig-8-like isoform X1 [Limulus polyphemus]